MATTTTWCKTSIDAERRTRRGQVQYRMGCDRCGTVRWLPLAWIGVPHCFRGAWGFLLKTRKG